MAAVKLRWPRALIQFEDFQSKHAIATLKRYRKEYLMFNDDIQVTVRESYLNCHIYDHSKHLTLTIFRGKSIFFAVLGDVTPPEKFTPI
jgi:hypothetical protein